MSSFDLAAFLPYQLAVLAGRVSRDFSAVYKERYGIGVAEWRVVAHLSQTSQTVSVREICDRVELEKSKVSRAVTRLQTRGWVAKQTNEEDRRLVELKLTEKGQKMIDEMAELATAFEQALMGQLPDQGKTFRAELLAVLEATASSEGVDTR
jgi:DNA-binding MarR family transcriptional regulator